MSLRGDAACRRWWFARELVVLSPVILLTLSACTSASAPSAESRGSSQRFRYDYRLFAMELTSVEVFDDEVKLTFLYTNRTDRTQSGVNNGDARGGCPGPC